MLEKVKNLITDLEQDNPGAEAVALYQNGELLLSRHFVLDIPRLIYSHTKSYVSTLAGIAIDEGKLTLDTTLCSLFPEYDGVITEEVARNALARFEIDELGLDDFDRKMLSIIIKTYNGGPVGLDTLAAAVGEESVTIEDVYEPYLMQIGFLSRTNRGRCVTHAAYDHLGIPHGNCDCQQMSLE